MDSTLISKATKLYIPRHIRHNYFTKYKCKFDINDLFEQNY